MTLPYRAARHAQLAERAGMGSYHLMQAAATIRASRWPVDSQLDTVLDAQYFGGAAEGLHAGARRVFRRDVERLDEAQLHVLMALNFSPGALDPWCHPDRLRKRVFATVARMQISATPAELDAALASIGPQPPDESCK
jgi:membrane carboxypeptidase/penicillin-binding protein PbpC